MNELHCPKCLARSPHDSGMANTFVNNDTGGDPQ